MHSFYTLALVSQFYKKALQKCFLEALENMF